MQVIKYYWNNHIFDLCYNSDVNCHRTNWIFLVDMVGQCYILSNNEYILFSNILADKFILLLQSWAKLVLFLLLLFDKS